MDLAVIFCYGCLKMLVAAQDDVVLYVKFHLTEGRLGLVMVSIVAKELKVFLAKSLPCPLIQPSFIFWCVFGHNFFRVKWTSVNTKEGMFFIDKLLLAKCAVFILAKKGKIFVI